MKLFNVKVSLGDCHDSIATNYVYKDANGVPTFAITLDSKRWEELSNAHKENVLAHELLHAYTSVQEHVKNNGPWATPRSWQEVWDDWIDEFDRAPTKGKSKAMKKLLKGKVKIKKVKTKKTKVRDLVGFPRVEED